MARSTRSSNSSTQAKVEPVEEKEIKTWGSGGLFASRDLGALLLLVLCPLFGMLVWYIVVEQKGSLRGFYIAVFHKRLGMGWWNFLKKELWVKAYPFRPRAMKIVGCYAAFEAFLQLYVPGKKFKATPTATGHIPVYKANGVACYLISIVALFALKYFRIFNPAIVYDEFGSMLMFMNLFALLFCLFLTIKGLNFPSTKDSGSNGSLIMDYFWGTELYPRIFGLDVKEFTNCRFGMMYWQIGILCYAFKQYDLYGYVSSSMAVSIAIQTAYIYKFYLWETGYFCSMDIQHDRAGYYICYGCLAYLPIVYTMHTLYLTEHPILLTEEWAFLIAAAGIFSVWCNYDCDRQRQEFRATHGKAKVWGKTPTFITAEYTTEDGQERTSLLLTSGWWGLSRHIHYIPEILASVFWCIPMQKDHMIAYFYPFYLTLLLLDRAWRDDARCADKYKQYWAEYCEIVPYKIIPGVV